MEPDLPQYQKPIQGVTYQQIAVLTFLTHGLYLIYWLFQTQRQQWNSAQTQNSSLLLCLSLLLPAANILRAHATAKSLKAILNEQQVHNNLQPWLPATAMTLLTTLTIAAPAEIMLNLSTPSAASALIQFLINALGVGAILLSILHCQRNYDHGKNVKERLAAASDPPANWDQNMAILLLITAGAILWLLQLVKLFNAFAA